MRVLVVFHFYYREQLDFFIEKLKNICDCTWDLIVTFNTIHDEDKLKLLKLKSDAIFYPVENAGYDVWPFISVLKNIDTCEYDIIVKLHTKSYTNGHFTINGVYFRGFQWRDELVDALLKNKKTFRQMLSCFKTNKMVGMYCSRLLLTRSMCLEDTNILDEELKKLGVKNCDKLYCAGTMFAISPKVLRPIYEIDYSVDMFRGAMQSNSSGTLAHAYERIFSILAGVNGFKIKISNPNIQYIYKLIYAFCFDVYHEIRCVGPIRRFLVKNL